MWSCGHRIELIPCSIVGHIFRQKNPSRFPGTDATTVLFFNRKRVVETWMNSPYKEIFYATTPHLIKKEFGDVSARLALRKRLKCKSFRWYQETMVPNLFPPLPSNLKDRVQIIVKESDQCIFMKKPKPEAHECPCTLELDDCSKTPNPSTSFYHTTKGELRGVDWPRLKWCLMLDQSGKVLMDTCFIRTDDPEHASKKLKNQQWEVIKSGNLKHIGTGKCITVDINSKDLPPVWTMTSCDASSAFTFRSVSNGKMSGVARIGRFAVGQEQTRQQQEEDDNDGEDDDSNDTIAEVEEEDIEEKVTIMRTISVVLPCAGEKRLMVKTVESIFEATPKNVLKEIIVVDDGSSPPIETYWDKTSSMTSKVRFLRHETTEGLMHARTTGANSALGDVIALLDCHVKPGEGWHIDILKEINENYKRVAVPVITSLDVDTWTEINRPAVGSGMSACYFTFDAEFKWANNRFYKENDGEKPWVPMMSGGLLAMSKRWWDELGGYDPMMQGWGGENIDQSLRIWQCGGEIVSVRNSFIAHMFRDGTKKTQVNYHSVGSPTKNKWRSVDGWLGPFKQAVLKYPDFARFRRAKEDLSWYNEIQKRLKCKPFSWYIDRFSDIYMKSGVLPRFVFSLESIEYPGFCLTAQGFKLGHAKVADGKISIEKCDMQTQMQTWGHANREHIAADNTLDEEETFHSLRLYQSDQSVRYKGDTFDTSVSVIDGSDVAQTAQWRKTNDNSQYEEGRIVLQGYDKCLGVQTLPSGKLKLQAKPCLETVEHSVPVPLRNTLPLWKKRNKLKSLERKIYEREKRKRAKITP